MEIEWVLASFALDNLFHRTCHICLKAFELRRGNKTNAESQIADWTTELFEEHSNWRKRPVIIIEDSFERQSQRHYGGQFLDYPALSIHNTFYAHLLNAWSALFIFIDLIAFPYVELSGKGFRRFDYAVDICRTYAALGQGLHTSIMLPVGTIVTTYLAGLGFGGNRRSPRETAWLNENLVNPIGENYSLNRSAKVLSLDVPADALGCNTGLMGGRGRLLGSTGKSNLKVVF